MLDEARREAIEAEIAAIRAEEQALALPFFGVEESWWLGNVLRDRAVAEGLSIAVQIVRGASTLFSCVTGTACRNHAEWMRRKIAVVQRFETSSLVLSRQCQLDPDHFAMNGLSLDQHVPAGGGVPILIARTGVVGVIAVSGLPEEVDHRLAIDALRSLARHLG